jgi:filamentous hemagglutinin
MLGGGKFENGAITGAFGYMFNACFPSLSSCFNHRVDGEGGGGGTLEPAEAQSGSPAALVKGQTDEAGILSSLGSSGKVPFAPTAEQIDSAGFKLIVGDPKYTPGGTPVGTIIYDGLTKEGLVEVKTGSSALDSSYQLRLQTYGALVNDAPYTIYTDRTINSSFQQWLSSFGVAVKPLTVPK